MTDRTATFDALCCAMAGPALLLMGCSPYYGAGSPYRESHGLGSSDLSEHPLFGRDDLANFESGASLGSERTRPDGTTADVGGGLPNVSALARLPVPLYGLSAAEIDGFETGVRSFQKTETIEDGLGPIFNGNSCGGCHSEPGPGGGSHFTEARFGRSTGAAGYDPLRQLGGDVQQAFSIDSEGSPVGCSFPIELIPPQANVRALRRTTPLFGLGLVDNVPDEELRLLASVEKATSPWTAGRVAVAINISTRTPMVSRFGWKAQVPNLFQFSGEAYVNEIGITSPQFPLENCPNDVANCALVQRCNPKPGLNNDGEDVQAFTDFMTFLAPLARGRATSSVKRGQILFAQTGCANCHTPTLVTGPSTSAALDRKVFHPYSDFLLHDFGQAADQIGPSGGDVAGTTVQATATEMRTAPLWGSRHVERFLHDGRARSIAEAVTLGHDGQGARARYLFQRLNHQQQYDLVVFVLSL